MKLLASRAWFLSILGEVVAQSCLSATCINALNGGTEGSIAKSSRQADCASYFRVTVVPPTSTITVYQTVSSANPAGQPNPQRASTGAGPAARNNTSNPTLWRRDDLGKRGDRSGGTVTLTPSNIPTWASVCGSGPQFSSACVCNGQSYITVTAPTPCVTTTLVGTIATPTMIPSTVPTVTETVSVTITLSQCDCLAGTLAAGVTGGASANPAPQPLYVSSNPSGQSTSGSSGPGSQGSSATQVTPGGSGSSKTPKPPLQPGKPSPSYGSSNPQLPSIKTSVSSQSGYFNSSVASLSTSSQSTTSNAPTSGTSSAGSTSQPLTSSSVSLSTFSTNSSSQSLPSSSSITTFSSMTTSVSSTSSTSSTASPTPSSNSTCEAVDWIISLLSIKGEADDFCSSLLQISPTVQTITTSSTPSQVVVTSTVVQSTTGFVTQTLTSNSTYVTTSTTDVTSVVLSTSTETTTDTSSTTTTSTSITTYTTTYTEDDTTTSTTTVPYAITDTVGTTSTLLRTTTVTPLPATFKKRATQNPGPTPSEWNNIGTNLLSKACSCLNLTGSTTSTTTTLLFPTPTSTVYASSNFTVTDTVSASTTLSIQSVSNVISIVNLTVPILVPSTTDVTSTTTTETTTTTTAFATVTSDVSTDRLTSSSLTGTSTTTSVTVTTQTVTIIATPTCGVNLVQNGDFTSNPGNYYPFVMSSTGAAEPYFDAGCGVDFWCPLIHIPGAGSETLTQTIKTFPGQTYTLSFVAASYGYSGTASLACSVDVPGSLPVAANLNDVQDPSSITWTKYQGTFTALGGSTKLTCLGTTDTYLGANIEAIHIEC